MRTKPNKFLILLFYFASGLTALAQDSEPGDPLSAIDWLSDVIRNPEATEGADDNISENASPTAIVTTTLDGPNIDATGLLPRNKSGLPANFWGHSSSRSLQMLIAKQRSDLPRPIVSFLKKLLLTELNAPIDSRGDGALFLARVDWLLGLGALEEARALLDRAGPDKNAALFSRWFDASLLTGQEEEPCEYMLSTPDLAPTYQARIFCLARGGQWDAAALTLNTGRILGLISEKEDALLARFLDPELFEGSPFLPIPDRITPLNFRMHEAIGEPLSLGTLPNAFAFGSINENEGWKTRISAAERLARSGALAPEQLAEIYSERSPAASGGVWDRVEAWQELDAALKANDAKAVATHLPLFIRAARRVGLDRAMADMLGPKLVDMELPESVKATALRLALLSDVYETAATSEQFVDVISPLEKAIATGTSMPEASDGLSAKELAVVAALTSSDPPIEARDDIAEGNFGKVLLEAFRLLEDGDRSDPAAIEQALSTFRSLSLTDLTRQTALTLLLDHPGA